MAQYQWNDVDVKIKSELTCYFIHQGHISYFISNLII